MPAHKMKMDCANFRRFVPQNWLPWQRTLTEVYQILSRSDFVIDSVNASLRVAICPFVVECHGRHWKSNISKT